METTFKAILAAALAALAVYCQQLLVPIAVLIICMAIDYASGVAKAWTGGTLSSAVGARGIIKKVCYLFVVAVSMIIDFVIQAGADRIGVDVSKYFIVALLVVIWLILNECVSILENLDGLVPLPSFLIKFVQKLKSHTEAIGETEANDNE